MTAYRDKVAGALYGTAIGDGMGAPVEGWAPEKIAARFRDVKHFFPKTGGGDPTTGKGDGRFTDDTLMVEALIRAYAACGDHMDAYGFERFFLREISETPVWLPEKKRDMPIMNRLWRSLTYPWVRIVNQGVEPRRAGQGNILDCGLAMYMMPVGAVNAGDPRAAYQEAAAFGLAHTESYAVEVGAVMAGIYAEAFAPTASIATVLEGAFTLAQDATSRALRSVLESVDPAVPLAEFIARARKAILPFDARATWMTDELHPEGAYSPPSRALSVEELPVALAALKYGAGDFNKTLHAAVFYGRDCDSIGGMAAGLYGAIFGVEALPAELRRASDEANRRNLAETANLLARTAANILEKDAQRNAARQRALGRSC